MASTYVNDLRLNEMATGDASGSWGTVTNTNLELIGEAFSYGTETIGDADSTLTIADGAADAARSFYLKITSSVDLTTTRIVTLGPNTVSKVWMIENATTGSQVITIKQGSGATINVPNGQVKMISTDGAGSGGAVLDLLVDVDLTGTTTLVNLDVSGTLGVTGVLTATSLDISGDIDVDGTTNLDVVDIDGATQIDATVTVGVDDTGYDVKFFGATAGAYMLWDESADDLILGGAAGLSVNSTALVTGVLTTTAATVFNGGFAAGGVGTFADGSNSAPSLTNTGDLNTGLYFPAADEVGLTVGGTQRLNVSATGIDVTGTVTADGLGVSGLVTLDDYSGNSGRGRINIGNSGQQYIEGYDSGNAGSGSYLSFGQGASERLRIDNAGNVGIGTSSPASTLHLQAAANTDTTLTVTGGVAAGLGSNAIIKLIPDGTAGAGVINIDGSDGSDVFQIKQSNATRLTIDSSGNLLVGKTAQSVDTVGGEILSTGIGQFTVNGNFAVRFTRQTSDGDIVVFRKGTGTVGSIGAVDSDLYLGSVGSVGLRFNDATNKIVPVNNVGANRDNAIDLGQSDSRFKDLYLSGGVYLGGTGRLIIWMTMRKVFIR
jgi:hypothetical protein